MSPRLNDFILTESAPVKEALEKMNINCKGICFTVDDNHRITGTLTDGDIRRGILKGAQLTDRVKPYVQYRFTTLPVETENEIILNHLNDRIKVIPLIDEDGIIVDYATVNKVRTIPVANSILDGNELNYVNQCIKTSWISSIGPFVKDFETMFSDLVEAPRALAVSNGTVALHLALLALGIGTGDEVIIPDLTFAATINAVIYTGATPVLADIDKNTWGLSVETIQPKISSKTKAIIPVHLYGHPCEMKPIRLLADKHNLYIIEDCAEAVGSKYYGKHVGYLADAATFSFFGNKTITTGEGGMVVFRDSEKAAYAEVVRDHGMSKTKKYWHEHLGYNFRMTNIQAAIGVAQFERLDEIVKKKRKIAYFYHQHFAQYEQLALPIEMTWAKNSFWLYTILLKGANASDRDKLISLLRRNGIETRPVFYPLHEMPPYRKFMLRDEFTVSSFISKIGISLPSSPDLDEESLFRVVETLTASLKEIGHEGIP